MKTQIQFKSVGAAIVLIGCLVTGGCLSPTTDVPEDFNITDVLIDSSGSYKDRQAEALDRAVALLEQISKQRVKRWERNPDRITIISVDALPSVLWQGSLPDLKEMDRSEWVRRFKARSDYAACTDVTGAFRLAAKSFKESSPHIHKYVFVFSDLINEAPTTTISKCSSPQGSPTEDFPWESFEDASVSVFWMPPNQKLAWERTSKERGLNNFNFYTTSESSAVMLAPPPRPNTKLTDGERQVLKQRYSNAAKNLLWACLSILAILLAVGMLPVLHQLLFRGQTPLSAQRTQLPAVSGSIPRRSGMPMPRTGVSRLGQRAPIAQPPQTPRSPREQ